MFKTKKILILCLVVSVGLFIAAASAPIIKINDLIENSKEYDNREVTIQGEVLGEALERGNYVWINITDNTNYIGIWLDASDAEKITFYGDYKHKGDMIKVTGIFHRACTEHGGDIDIHNLDMQVIQKGSLLQEKISASKIIAVIASGLIMFLVIGIYKILK